MGDKQGQQRRRRVDGAVRSVADRSVGEENRPFTPEAAQAAQGWTPLDRESPRLRRDSVDSPQRRSLARPAGEISASFDFWRRLRDWEERGIWRNIWRTFLGELNGRQQLKWSESFLDGSFAPAKKGLRSRKNQARQRDEVDGGGRRPRCSCGKLPSLCILGGS